MRFTNVRDALLRGSVAEKGTRVFLEVAGPSTSGIQLSANALTAAKDAVSVWNGVSADAVHVDAKCVTPVLKK
jgi:hypothetical protein